MEGFDKRNNNYEPSQYWKISLWLTIFFFVLLVVLVWGYNMFYPSIVGTEQPIAFSHRIHAGVKQISCFMCHDLAATHANAGIPSTETCMLCHRTIIIHHPEVEKVRAHYFNQKPVEWIKITTMPDYVFFNHSMHIIKGIDCSACHGNISEMDRVFEVKELTMGFCMGCHREMNASTDCFTCHR